MLRLKPTILISLDPYAAAFCERVQLNLQRDLGYSGSLVSSYGVIVDHTGPRIHRDLSAIANFSFDLSATGESNVPTTEEAQAVFESSSFELEPELSEIFEAGRRYTEIERARQAGIELAQNRVIYLLLSSVHSVAGAVIIELARLVRWLFTTRFSQELYELHAVVLLPNLFEHANQKDFATAYALLKKLDHHISTRLTITASRKMVPFEGCWLLDGVNLRGEKIGTVTEQLDSYTDAFTGFLTAEPEMSGALVGTRTCRGKVPAYNTFGHGEIYFPVDVSMKRLSSALSRDIIDQGFLCDGPEQSDLQRKMLLATKQFVLGEDYRNTISRMETDKGAPIWQDLPPTAELQREGDVLQYLAEQQRHQGKFERDSIPKFKQLLVAQSDTCFKELVKLLDKEIDRRIDEKCEGLSEVPAFLERLVDHSIALHATVLGERPQNFITDLLVAEAMLDTMLGVQIDHSKTELLLKQVNALSNRLADLESTLRLTNSRSIDSSQSENDSELTESLRSERKNLISQIEETRSEIASIGGVYVRDLIAEQRAANDLRYEAKDKVRTNRAQAVTDAEAEVMRTAESLSRARLDLEDRQRERQQFLIRYFIIYPAVAALLLIVPAFASFLGISLAAVFIGFLWSSLFGLLLFTFISLTVYTAAVLYSFMTGINRAVNLARDEVNRLELSLKAAHVRVRDARNQQLRFEYDIYAQSMRAESINKLIGVTRERIVNLETTQNALRECRARFAAEHKSTLPASSYMRRPILSAEQIDEFYTKIVTNVETESATFIHEDVSRSKVRRMAIEDFAQRLETFARSRFKSLSSLSIEDVLLRSPDLITEDQASLKLEELDRAATPLVRLSEMDLNDDTFAQKDVTIWAGAGDSEALLNRYRKVNSTTTIRPSTNEHSLRALTRCLNFPAFYLSQIEFYRSCYERSHEKEALTLADVIPDELTISSESRRAYEHLLIAIATGLISHNGDGTYQLVDDTGSVMGSSRRQIAEKFAIDYRSQKIYAEICERLVKCESDTIYDALVDFTRKTSDLEPFERELLKALSQKYHPLR